jgi:hypothetical protein
MRIRIQVTRYKICYEVKLKVSLKWNYENKVPFTHFFTNNIAFYPFNA